jgi:hypothetical protein
MPKTKHISTLPSMSRSAVGRPRSCSPGSGPGRRGSAAFARRAMPSTLCWVGDELAQLPDAGCPTGGGDHGGGLADCCRPSLLRSLPRRPAPVRRSELYRAPSRPGASVPGVSPQQQRRRRSGTSRARPGHAAAVAESCGLRRHAGSHASASERSRSARGRHRPGARRLPAGTGSHPNPGRHDRVRARRAARRDLAALAADDDEHTPLRVRTVLNDPCRPLFSIPAPRVGPQPKPFQQAEWSRGQGSLFSQ